MSDSERYVPSPSQFDRIEAILRAAFPGEYSGGGQWRALTYVLRDPAAELARLARENERLHGALERIAHGHDEHAAIVCASREDRDREDQASWALGWAQGVSRQALGESQNEWTSVPLAFAEKHSSSSLLSAALSREGEVKG